MTDLVTWLRQQLDREEGDANLIPGGGYQPARWTAHRVPDGDWAEIRQHDLPVGAEPDEVAEESTAGLMTWGRNEDLHVTRWDPARVLAEVAAKRAILDAYTEAVEFYDAPANRRQPAGEVHGLYTALQWLAVPCASNGGYDESWRPA